VATIDILILALATWRLSHLLALEDGPWHILTRVRKLAGERLTEAGVPYAATHLAEGVTCLWCNSMWFGCVFAILFATCGRIALVIALPFALSAAAIVIDSGIEAILRGIQEWR